MYFLNTNSNFLDQTVGKQIQYQIVFTKGVLLERKFLEIAIVNL